MTTSNEALIAKRRAAMNVKKQAVPEVQPANIPEAAAPIKPLRPQAKAGPASHVAAPYAEDAGDGEDRDDESPSTVAPIRRPSSKTRALAASAAYDPSRTIEQSDLVMPKLKLSQAMSKVNSEDIVRQGNYYHSTNNDNLGKTVLIAPVDMRKSRSYFVQGQGVLCRSFDMIQGEGNPGLLCEGTPEEIANFPASERGCPLRLWGEKDPATGRSKPPACGVNYNYPVMLLDSEKPNEGLVRRAMFTIRATATPVARAINSIVTENDLQWHDAVLELGVDSKSNMKGTFFVPTVRFVGLLSDVAPNHMARAETFASQISGAAVRATLEAEDDD